MNGTRKCVACLVLTTDGLILLQQRDRSCKHLPGYLAPFGGGIKEGESPIAAVIRELHEELGALIKPGELIYFGNRIDQYDNYKELVHLFFWHDKNNQITGCYEGEAKKFANANAAIRSRKIMNDAVWLLNECSKKRFIA